MKEAYQILPVYTGDVSGACSALFELGGMVIIHDPSGCNSTYNTHDELRWYDQNSLIFLSGLSEMDAILGDDQKLIDEIKSAAEQLKPKFIALTNSPIPYMNGTDLDAIAWQIEQETGIPAFYVPTNGMHDYARGAGLALEKLVESRGTVLSGSKNEPRGTDPSGSRVVSLGTDPSDSKNGSKRNVPSDSPSDSLVNLMGVTPLDFGRKGMVTQLKAEVAKQGYELLATWAMGDSLEALTASLSADKNIVVSTVGMKAAKALQASCGIPYETGEALLAGMDMTKELLAGWADMLQAAEQVVLIGEPITMQGLAQAITEACNKPCQVINTLEAEPEALKPDTLTALTEEEVQTLLKEASVNKKLLVVADPLYRPILPEGSALAELPHLAFSGRIYFGLDEYVG